MGARFKAPAVMLAGFAMLALPCSAAPVGNRSKAAEKADRLAEQLVQQLTPEEKLDQLLNTAPAIPRLGVPRYNWWTESLHGVAQGGPRDVTNFPQPVGLAATFDDALVKEVAASISVELRGLHTLARQTGKTGRIGTGLDTWSPNINIFRDPRWGRGQETYGEDPYLAARMGVAYIQGIQGPDPDLPDVIATPKHYAVHSGPESTRHSANVYVSAHDLEDTYLPAFRAAIVEGRAGSVMCAYNRIDGQPACASDMLLKDYLRDSWGFDGYVVSDCDAVEDINRHHHYAPDAATAVAAAIRAGVDSECNGATLVDTAGLGDRYREALARGLISREDIDRALIRLFSARYRVGDLPGVRPANAVSPARVGTAEHGQLALKAAERSIVLLKNNGVLPLTTSPRIAVIGPLGDATRVLRGNYSSGLSPVQISVVDGLRAAMPASRVEYVPFGESFTDGDSVPTSALRSPEGKPGLLARYFNPTQPAPVEFAPGTFGDAVGAMKFSTTPAATRIEPSVADRHMDFRQVSDHHRVEWTGFLVPPETGSYRLGLTGFNGEMHFEGKHFVDLTKARWNSLPTMKTVKLVKGRRYPVRVSSEAHVLAGVGLVWKRVSPAPEADMRRAARDADLLVAVVGLTSDLEAEETGVKVPGFEGGDKTNVDVPADQMALLQAAKATGKPLIVIAMNGSPLNLSWAKDNADALLEAWYPGQAGGLALGNVLTGKINPSGRLPLTFYRSVEDLPPFGDYAMKGRTYRYFGGAPVYPFGYGLSYTSFAYGPLKVSQSRRGAEDGMTVTAEVRNSGSRAGDEVAQLYLDFPEIAGAPRLALRGYQRVSLQPGETRTLKFDLSPRDLSAVSEDGIRSVFKGRYVVSVGSGQPGTGVPGRSAEFVIDQPAVLPK